MKLQKRSKCYAPPPPFEQAVFVDSLDELAKLYQQIADTKGSRKVKPSRIDFLQGGDDPNITVMIWIEDESISIFVKPGKEYRVVGFSD